MQRHLSQARAQRGREQALRATLAILRREGVGSVTLRAVAAEARIPIGSLTYYFADKGELLREAVSLWVDEEVTKVTELAATIEAEALSPRAATERCAELLQGYDPEQVAQYELYLHAARSRALRAVVEDAFRAYDHAVAAALKAAGLHDAERLAPLFVAMADGLGLRRVAAPSGSPDLASALLELFRALDASPAAGRGSNDGERG